MNINALEGWFVRQPCNHLLGMCHRVIHKPVNSHKTRACLFSQLLASELGEAQLGCL